MGLPGSFIEEILQNWKDNYELLEENHSYIQWWVEPREREGLVSWVGAVLRGLGLGVYEALLPSMSLYVCDRYCRHPS